MAALMKNQRYTPAQKDWIKEKAQMKRYRTRGGQIKRRKLLSHFEQSFGVDRPINGFGASVRKFISSPVIGREPRVAKVVRHEMPTFPETTERLRTKVLALEVALESVKEFLGI